MRVNRWRGELIAIEEDKKHWEKLKKRYRPLPLIVYCGIGTRPSKTC